MPLTVETVNVEVPDAPDDSVTVPGDTVGEGPDREPGETEKTEGAVVR